VGDTLRGGADVVCFSGDKLLGGPQAGIIVGDTALIQKMRESPVYRALRPPKEQLYLLERCLLGYCAGKPNATQVMMRAGEDDLRKIPEVGPVMAGTLMGFFRLASTRRLVEKLRAAGVSLIHAAPKGPQPLRGRVFVFTGELSGISRSEAEGLVRQLGAKTASSVSRLTSYVVVGANPGSKFTKAQGLGVTLLNEAQFQQLIKQHGE
jgi:selenocysteine lyase/cysteine desulfurase